MKRPMPTRTALRSPMARLAAIAPVLEYRRLAKGRRRAIVRLEGREFHKSQDMAQRRAAQLKISERTLWRWLSRFKRGGYDALADGRRDKGRSRFFTHHPDQVAFIAQFSRRRTSALAILELMQASQEFRPLPSIAVLRAHLRSLKEADRAARLARRRAERNGAIS